jgi:hypothetical protein
MSETKSLPVRKLTLDTRNFRTIPQTDEVAAIHALIAIDTDWFWALMESLIETGYLPTENIILIKEKRKHIVKEGNRRIAAMKILHGYVDVEDFDLPTHIQEKQAALTTAWKKQNSEVPCTVYEATEGALVDRVVALTHGKGEKAGRATWKAVARARHNRDMALASEPGLDLLEKFLGNTKKLTPDQKERWAGDYPVSVLDEAMKRLASRLGFKSSPDLAKGYPKLRDRAALDELILDIGMKHISFANVRAADFGTGYGLPPPVAAPTPSPTGSPGDGTTNPGNKSGAPTPTSPTQPPSPTPSPNPASPRPPKAHPAEDPKTVTALLKKFQPRGAHREKVATLLGEIRQLDLSKHPHAFCFLLRSMFELSAKAYCLDHVQNPSGPKATKADGDDRRLVDVLRDIVHHLTKGSQDRVKTKLLQGAITQLASNDSILSVTSMNQLIHNPRFVITTNDVAVMFGNIFPLLDEMNK